MRKEPPSSASILTAVNVGSFSGVFVTRPQIPTGKLYKV